MTSLQKKCSLSTNKISRSLLRLWLNKSPSSSITINSRYRNLPTKLRNWGKTLILVMAYRQSKKDLPQTIKHRYITLTSLWRLIWYKLPKVMYLHPSTTTLELKNCLLFLNLKAWSLRSKINIPYNP